MLSTCGVLDMDLNLHAANCAMHNKYCKGLLLPESQAQAVGCSQMCLHGKLWPLLLKPCYQGLCRRLCGKCDEFASVMSSLAACRA